MKVNDKREALGAAKSYVKNLHMSKDAVYDQLVSPYGEEFTEAQATWAVAHLG